MIWPRLPVVYGIALMSGANGAIARFAEQLSGIRAAELAASVLEVARQRLFDTAACSAAGADTPEADLMRRLEPEASSVAGRIRYAVAATRCTELDDIHIRSCTTVGAVVVPVALLAASSLDATDEDVLCAAIAGYEAMARLGWAIDGALRLYEGVWPTYLTAPFAAAAVAARLARLDAGRTADALAIAISRSSGLTPRVSGLASSRWLLAGCAAADGYLAARAAQSGMAGDPQALEELLPRTGVSFDPERFENADGWRILEIDTKPFRTSRQGLSATEAYLQLLDQHAGSHVESVTVGVPRQVKAMLDRPEPTPRSLGIQQQLAAATLDRLALWDVAGRRQADAGPRALMDRIQVIEDQKLTALYPEQWGGRVEVRWSGGTMDSLEVLNPRGCARAPFGWRELLDKH